MKTKPGYIPSLDGIRAIAVLLVFFSHILPIVPGMPGVTLFFFLSGYLITTLLRMEYGGTHRVDFGAFYLRRCVRILPPLYIVLAAAVLLQKLHFLPGRLDGGGFASELLFAANYRMIWDFPTIGPGLYVLWTLAVEEHFYLLFPVVFLMLSRHAKPRAQSRLLGFAVASFLLWRLVLHFGLHAGVARTMYGSDTRMDSILFGCIMAIIANPVLGDPLSARIQANQRWLLPLSLATLLFDMIWHNVGFRETLRYTLDGLALFSCFTFAITAKESKVFRILNWAPVRFIGLISYDVYLCHGVIIQLVSADLRVSPRVLIATSLTASVATGSFLYFMVDRPLARWKKRFERRPARVMAPVATSG